MAGTLKFDVEVSVKTNDRTHPGYSINTDLSGEVTLMDFLQFTRDTLVVIAAEALKEEQAKGFDKDPVVTVDGRAGKSVYDVNPLGSIEFTARVQMKQILLDTYAGLSERSPVLKGVYKSSNFVVYNDKQVATDQASLQAWLDSNPNFQDGEFIKFINVQPYARKLERMGITAATQGTRRDPKGRTSKRTNKKTGKERVRVNLPNGTYFLTARAIRAKYKRNSTIKFTFIAGSQLGLSGNFAARKSDKGKPRRPYVYPAIVISVKEAWCPVHRRR